ncbi:hypothetical protein BS50DRAFT_575250 [Corynespora cassiicola Philippines]|uniref:EthD domain-containing protein n=1 Tax=Corynespora cassiicola Philippines TaxID=1448308 RepID=A0A2T2NIV3_CORCC|nr:hypothetical protein BS50DRAFT_575250 [Corynespora cassiicola Philippines]
MACHSNQKDLPCPNHYIHPYNFPELRIGTGSNEQPYFRAMVFFNKKPGLTDEFFHEHWKSVHADLTMQVENAGITLARYVQFHSEEKDRKAIAPLIESGNMQFLPFDGAAEFHCKDGESFVKFMNDVYSSPNLVGCGTRFVDMTVPYSVMVGHDNLIFGKAVESSGGSDGVLRGDPRFNTTATTEKVEPAEPVAPTPADDTKAELKTPQVTVNGVETAESSPASCH